MSTKRRGFTIIEILIVLAIMGAILLILFIAVPALKRSSRNYQRRADAALLLSSVSTKFANDGKFYEKSCNNISANCWVTGENLAFYDNDPASETNNVSYLYRSSPWENEAAVLDGEIPETEPALSTFDPTPAAFPRGYAYNRVSIRTYTRCSKDPDRYGHFTSIDAIESDAAIQFLIETAGGWKLQCYET